MKFDFSGKTVLVVGGSKGIGKQICLTFAKEGAKVVTIARSSDLLSQLKKEMDKLNNLDNKIYCHDLMNCNIGEVVEHILYDNGVFDIVVHNVGGSLTSRDPLGDYNEWEYAVKFNAGVAIEFNHFILPKMIERKSGKIIHVSSISSKNLRGNPQYASAKEFLNAYVTTVGRSVAKSGVVMSAIMPGAVSFEGSYWDKRQHDFNKPADGGKSGNEICVDYLSHHMAVNRFGTTDEIANVVLFLASDYASFMQGAVVPVDGGTM